MSNDVETRSQRRRIVLMVMASAFMIWLVPAMDFFAGVADGGMNLKGALATAGFLVWAAGLVFSAHVRKNGGSQWQPCRYVST